MRNIVSPLSGIVSPFGLRDGGALSAYAILSLEPPLVLDFDESYFRTGGTATDLVSAATHTRAGNATMVDSDGFRKWAPHNLITNSEEFDNAAWTKYGVTVSGTDLVIPTATLSYHFVQNSAASFISKYTKEFEAKPEGYNFVRLFMGIIGVGVDLDLVNKTFSNKSPEYADPVFTDSTDGFVKVSIEYIGTRTNKAIALQPEPSALNTTTFTGDGVSGVRFREARLYRSDLGGMVNNPATGDSYVPTTDAAVYLPRVGHHIWNGSAWVDEGYFHESEARTNLITYSEQFDNAAWIKSGASITANQAISPDGTQNADFLNVTTGGVYQTSGTVTANVPVTISVWVKRATSSDQTIRFRGQVGGGSNVFSSDFIVTDTWTLISYTWTPTSTFPPTIGIVADSIGTASLIYVFGAQLEAGSTPSSYIPTAGATVTRAADAMTIPAANLPWNPLAVSIQMEGRMTYADTGSSAEAIFFNWSAPSANIITSRFLTNGAYTGAPQFLQYFNGALAAVVESVPGSYSPGVNVPFNIASRHGSTFINGAVDGTALTANLTPTALPYLENTDMQIGTTFNGTIKLFRVWADDLTDEGIAEASA